MSPRLPRSRRAHAVALVIAISALAACSGPGQTTAPSSAATPAGSGTAACTTAPEPPTDLPGWDVASQTPSLFPYVISDRSDLTCGPVRFMFSFLDKTNRPVAAPDRTVSIALFNVGRDGNAPIATADGTFIWAIEDEVGIYVTSLTFPEAGIYGAEFTTAQGGAAPEKIRALFQVHATSPLVKVGQEAPATDNPTLADFDGDVARISTDAEPLESLYESTVADALAANEPFLVAFATPAFCKTAQCGPTLDRLKPFVSRYPGVTFINVEPYKLTFVDGSLEPELDPATQLLVPVEATEQWGLTAEPWVFVVDRDGIVRGSFGLIFSDAELTTALDAVK